MPTGFIIMQIGNKDLDDLCKNVIEPAFRKCGLDPKRVDKHHQGGLLKSEIVAFIDAATVIVADLTNERPNCYLEVGYAMGLGKFRNLVLTAREDLLPTSPNYRPDGQRVHFDLAGYEIIDWSPSNLDDFGVRLEAAINRRKKLVERSETVVPSQWIDLDWLARHRAKGLAGIEAAACKGFQEVMFAIQQPKRKWTLQEIASASARTRLAITGWPIGVNIYNDENCRPKPQKDGIVAMIPGGQGSFDYWSLSVDGNFYTARSMMEDRTGGNTFNWDSSIIRVTEAILYCTNLLANLGADKSTEVVLAIRYSGLATRYLSTEAMGRLPTRGRCAEDEYESKVRFQLNEVAKDLPGVVRTLLAPLFELFDFFSLDTVTFTTTVTEALRKANVSL